MKKSILQKHIEHFDYLYHQLLKQNLLMYEYYPEELKNLTPLDISVINISASNSDIIVREVAESLKIPNSTLTSSLNRLEAKGIANRVISRRDRRSFGIELTEKGLQVQKAHIDFERKYFENILNRLDTDAERETFLELLSKIINNEPDSK